MNTGSNANDAMPQVEIMTFQGPPKLHHADSLTCDRFANSLPLSVGHIQPRVIVGLGRSDLSRP